MGLDGWMAPSGVQVLAKVNWKMLCEKQLKSWMVKGQQIWQKAKEAVKGTGAAGQCPEAEVKCEQQLKVLVWS